GGKGGRGEHDRLAREHQAALWHGGQGGPDHAGAVFAGDDKNAQHADGDLRQVEATEADPGRIKGRLLAGAECTGKEDAEQYRDCDVEHYRRRQRPECGTDRAELTELRPQYLEEMR